MEPFVLQGGTVGSDIKGWRNLVEKTDVASLDRDATQALQFLKQVFSF